MRIAIIGGGSVGLLFAAYLHKTNDITLYCRTKLQRDQLREKGLLLLQGLNKVTCSINVRSIDQWEDDRYELVIICVKQYALRPILNTISTNVGPPLLFIQNGMGHIPFLNQLHSKAILLGTVEHGALRLKENTVKHTGIGITKLSVFKEDHRTKGIVEELISTAVDPFPFSYERDYKQMLIGKLMINAIINPLTAVLGVKNGKLLDNPYYKSLFEQLFNEVALAIKLSKDNHYSNVIRVCKNTALNESSMLRDIKNNNRTEIDAILGYVLEEARKNEVNVPLTHTLYQCIKGKELEGEG